MNDIVVGLGEVLWDILPDGRKLGGAPANFAYHAGRFGFRGVAVSAVGRDSLGDEAINEITAHGLQCEVQRVDYPTGTVQVSVSEEGIPTYDITEGVAWDNIPFTPSLEALASRCRAVCFGTLAQRSATSRATIGRFLDATPDDCLKIFDINLRQHYYSEEVIVQSLHRCDVLKINDEELSVVAPLLSISGAEIQSLCRGLMTRFSLPMLILTCGTEGSYVFTADNMSFMDTPKVNVVDTVGAGDSFTGAFTAAVLRSLPISEAHRIAVEVSAYVCTQSGAMPPMPKTDLLSD